MDLALITLLSFTVAMAVLLWLALRGRRVDQHPICRKCGYDLSATPELPSHCSECGHDLARRRALQSGNRKRIGWLAVIAGFLLIIGIISSGILFYSNTRQVDWNRHMPGWMLVMKGEGAFGSDYRETALDELLRRFELDDLSRPAHEDTLDLLLDLQQARDPLFSRPWAIAIHDARRSGRVDDDRYRRLLRQLIEHSLGEVQTRPRIRAGGPIPFLIRFDGNAAMGKIGLRMKLAGATIGEAALQFDDRELDTVSFPGYLVMRINNVGSADPKPGEHELAVTLEFDAELIQPDTRSRWNDITWIDDDPVLSGFRITRTTTVDIVPADEAVIEHLDSQEVREAIRAGITAELHGVVINMTQDTIETRGEPIKISLGLQNEPVNVIAEVFQVYADGSRESVGNLTSGQSTMITIPLIDGDAPETITLLLESRPEQAEQTVDLGSPVWSGQLLLKEIQITPSGIVIPGPE